MVTVGLDKIGFFTPNFVLDLVDLAHARDIDPDKFTIGIGQDEQAIIPPTQDVVTMGTNAAAKILTQADRDALDMVIFATESGIDHSKSGAVYIQKLLQLPDNIRTIELKQACYAGTYGLMQAQDYVRLHPKRRVLVIASDIARYGLNSGGEVTQGGGAIAMLVSANPRIATLHDDSVYMSQDIADFWRPLDRTEALVDGKYSAEVYKHMFTTLYARYQAKNNLGLSDFAGMAFHLPFTKMGKKALDEVIMQYEQPIQDRHYAALKASQIFSRRVGNLYTGSVYLALLSLLTHGDLRAGDTLGVFSYGSGAEAELYRLQLVEGFEQQLNEPIGTILDDRQRVSVREYETMYRAAIHTSTNQSSVDFGDTARYRLIGVQDGQRQYQEFA
jgi:hydroxymethylglutaryl-CoA synthase